MRHYVRGLLALLPVALLPSRPPATVPFVAAALRSPVEGYVVTQTLSSDTPRPLTVTLRVKVAQGKVRFEMEAPELAAMGGLYMLTRDDGKIVTVMTQMGMAILMDPAALGSMQGAAGLPAVPTISDMTFTVDDQGPGEQMLGLATHKYRYHTTYTSTTADKGAVKNDGTIDALIAKEIPGLADGLQKFTESFGGSFTGLSGGGSKDLSDAMKAKAPKGYPVKMVIKSAQTGADGATTNMSSTIEVTEFAKATFDTADFEVPAGIQVMDMATLMQGRGGHPTPREPNIRN